MKCAFFLKGEYFDTPSKLGTVLKHFQSDISLVINKEKKN